MAPSITVAVTLETETFSMNAPFLELVLTLMSVDIGPVARQS
jgi:hypothetical protein